MGISLKLQLYTSKKYEDGSSPIILLYTIDRKRIKKVLDKCKPEDWDKKTLRIKSRVPNAARINHYISTEFAKAEKDLYDIKSGIKSVGDLFQSSERITLQDCLNAELIRAEKEHKPAAFDKVLVIQKRIKDTSIDLNAIDEVWFENWIRALSNLGNSMRTVKDKVKLLRGIIGRYNKAGVSQEIKDIKVKTTKTIKQKLTREEFERIVNLELDPTSLKDAARDLFVLQVYLRGIRIGDLLQAYSSNFVDGRFVYTDDKTGKLHDVKLLPPAIAIVEKYAGKHDRLFPFFKWKPDNKLSSFVNQQIKLKHKEACTATVNYRLQLIGIMCDITKPLSSHIARHTYARMAIDKINNPMITMELLGHSDLKVHQGYLNDIRKNDELDAANDDIFG